MLTASSTQREGGMAYSTSAQIAHRNDILVGIDQGSAVDPGKFSIFFCAGELLLVLADRGNN